MSEKAKRLAARYGKKSDIIEIAEEIINEQYHINAFNYPTYPIVTSDAEIQAYTWGLIPFWIKNKQDADQIRIQTLNARSETIFTKPSFRVPIKKNRCLIPSTGYFEWQHQGNKKIPYYIYLKDQYVFSIAGIFDTWEDPQTGKVYTTFAMLTTQANELASFIHNGGSNPNRMPAIILKENEAKW